MHPIQTEFSLFTYEDSDSKAVHVRDFIPVDHRAGLRQKR